MAFEQGVKTLSEEVDSRSRDDLVLLAALVRRKADRKLGRPSPALVMELIEAAEREGNPVLELVTPWPK